MALSPDRYKWVADQIREHEQDSRPIPAYENEIREAEDELGVLFPNSYIWFLKEFGSAYWPDYIYGLGENLLPGQNVVIVTKRERHLVEPELSKHLIPFSPDGGGNHYCLDTSQVIDGECPVVFWSHELGDNRQPLQTHPSFFEWLEEQINLTVSEERG